MRGVGHDSPVGPLASAVELEGEHQVRRLRLRVGLGRVVALLPLQVVEFDAAHSGRRAAQRRDTGVVGGAKQRQQVAGQREVAEMVAAELQLESVGRGLAFGRLHDAGVVDQDVDRPAFGVELLAERGDAGQRRKVEALDGQLGVGHLGADLLDGGFAFGAVADGHHHVGACGRQSGGEPEAEAGVRAGDDGELSGQVGDGDGEVIAGHEGHSLSVDNRTITNQWSDNKSPAV